MDHKLLRVLLGQDELGSVVRAHIYIEEHIDKFPTLMSDKNEYIEKMSLDFSNKLRLALALGLDEELHKPLVALSNIRNKFAHKTDSCLNKSDVNNFYKSFVGEDKVGLQKIIEINPDRPKDLAEKYSKLAVREQFILMGQNRIFLSIPKFTNLNPRGILTLNFKTSQLQNHIVCHLKDPFLDRVRQCLQHLT